MAAAADVTVAEVEILVGPGELEADQIHTPGIYVQRIIQGASYAKPIEQRTVRRRDPERVPAPSRDELRSAEPNSAHAPGKRSA
jgi:hypothetical protein